MATNTPHPDKSIRLTLTAQIQFAALLANPPEPNAALKRAQEAHRRLIVSSE